MEQHPSPTGEQIDALTAYLRRFYAEGFSPIESWSGGDKQEDGSFTSPYPNYNPLVEEFFTTVAKDGWLDHEYNPEQAYEMLQDENLIKSASLDQIKTMLTFCARGERFSDGHWGEMIEKGYMRRLLERLEKIKSEQFE
jgi:hypothetical protein